MKTWFLKSGNFKENVSTNFKRCGIISTDLVKGSKVMDELIKWLGQSLHGSQVKLLLLARKWPWVIVGLVFLFILV